MQTCCNINSTFPHSQADLHKQTNKQKHDETVVYSEMHYKALQSFSWNMLRLSSGAPCSPHDHFQGPALRGSRGITLLFLYPGAIKGGGERRAPAALTLGKRPGTHCTRGWVGPRAGLNACGISRPPTGFEPQIPKDQCIPPNRRHCSTLPEGANASHCHGIPKQAGATLCQHRLLSHCSNTHET
jgi:hypothetical protein